MKLHMNIYVGFELYLNRLETLYYNLNSIIKKNKDVAEQHPY